MFNENLNIWLLAVCLMIPSLWLIVKIFISLKKRNIKSNIFNFSATKNGGKNYEDAIAFEVACQKLNELLVNTIDNLEKQRQFFNEYISKNNAQHRNLSNSLSHSGSNVIEMSKEKKEVDSVEKTYEKKSLKKDDNLLSCESDYNYRHIDDLYKSGMTSKQISIKTKIPQAEIDLYIKLNLTKNPAKKSPVSIFQLSV